MIRGNVLYRLQINFFKVYLTFRGYHNNTTREFQLPLIWCLVLFQADRTKEAFQAQNQFLKAASGKAKPSEV